MKLNRRLMLEELDDTLSPGGRMKIGVVMTCRNAWEYTEAALASIQSEHDTFVCVVDDGSTDGTKKGLKAWQSEDKANRWVFYDPPFDSLAGKWNVGVRRCWDEGCTVVCVANNDILLHPTTLDRMAKRLSDGDVVMVTAHNIEGIFSEKGIPPEFITSDECALDAVEGEADAPDFSCFMISRECWDDIGMFDERYRPAYFEDNDYHERIIRHGKRAISIASAPYYHYGSVTQKHDETPDPVKDRRFEATRHEFYQKWGFWPHGNAVLGSKIKLMVVGDGDRPTGFARVVHSILERLAATGDYDIHHLAINFFGDPPAVPWNMYPAHLSAPPDMFGRGRMREFHDKIQPDAVLMVQDPWHISDYVRARAGMRGLVSYYPVDSPNLNPAWMMYQARCVRSVTYTKFGAEQSAIAAQKAFEWALREAAVGLGPGGGQVSCLEAGGGNHFHDRSVLLPLARLQSLTMLDGYDVIPHGVDTAQFTPCDKRYARKHHNIPVDHFVAGYVHRNQPRKRQDAMIRAWAKFVTGLRDRDIGPDNISTLASAERKITDATLVLHAPLDSQSGWDLNSLIGAYGLTGSAVLTAETVTQDSMDHHDLMLLMNCFDVNANTGGGEGWGLSHMESAACGVAQLVPEWSATREIWDGNASLIRVAEVHHADHNLNTAQAVVDTDAVADALLELYEDRKACEALGEKAKALVSRPEYSWDSVAARFDEVLKMAATVKGVPEQHFRVRLKEAA